MPEAILPSSFFVTASKKSTTSFKSSRMALILNRTYIYMFHTEVPRSAPKNGDFLVCLIPSRIKISGLARPEAKRG